MVRSGSSMLSKPFASYGRASPSQPFQTIPALQDKKNCQVTLSVVLLMRQGQRETESLPHEERTACLAIKGQGQTTVLSVGMDVQKKSTPWGQTSRHRSKPPINEVGAAPTEISSPCASFVRQISKCNFECAPAGNCGPDSPHKKQKH